MAVPTNATLNRTVPLKTGVMLGVSPSSDPTFDMEVVRATSSGVYSTVARLTAKGAGMPVVFEDLLPVDGKARSYKARAVKDGWLAGDYTTAVTVKPTYLPETPPKVTPITGQQLGVPLFLSTAVPPQYGSVANPQAYTKGMGIYPFQFMSTGNTVGYMADARRLYPTSTAATYKFWWQSILPDGSSVSAVDVLYYRPSTKGSLRVRIQALTATTATITVFDYTATGTGAGMLIHASTNGFSGNAGMYALVEILSTSGTAASVALRQLQFGYRQPDLAVGV